MAARDLSMNREMASKLSHPAAARCWSIEFALVCWIDNKWKINEILIHTCYERTSLRADLPDHEFKDAHRTSEPTRT